MDICNLFDDNPRIIHSPVSESIRQAMKLICRQCKYMEDTGEEFTDSERYNALVRILNESSRYFRKNLY